MSVLNRSLSVVAFLLFAGACYSADAAPKYDMKKYKGVAEEALKLVKSADYAGAAKKTVELETAWDDDTKKLKEANRKVWKAADDQMDVAMKACEAAKDATSAEKATKELNGFIALLAEVEKLK
ncbi:MAG: hypothetical protein WCT04_02640 [Planctomycetota bacterium]